MKLLLKLLKKMIHPYWRLLIHMFLMCLSENRVGTGQLNQIQSVAYVSLIENWNYNY
ncbi:hypothetical protein Hanom_Chr12g01121181 [Helianthus anomalus]